MNGIVAENHMKKWEKSGNTCLNRMALRLSEAVRIKRNQSKENKELTESLLWYRWTTGVTHWSQIKWSGLILNVFYIIERISVFAQMFNVFTLSWIKVKGHLGDILAWM